MSGRGTRGTGVQEKNGDLGSVPPGKGRPRRWGEWRRALGTKTASVGWGQSLSFAGHLGP